MAIKTPLSDEAEETAEVDGFKDNLSEERKLDENPLACLDAVFNPSNKNIDTLSNDKLSETEKTDFAVEDSKPTCSLYALLFELNQAWTKLKPRFLR